MNGFLVVDKPPGLTSHDVVAIVRAITGIPKVGHTGTLDPFATGVLPLALGRATRLVQFLDESIKVYDATVRLGSATDTGDPTGQVVREAALPTIDRAGAETIVASFVGDRMQEPPAFSAVKVEGKPLYHYARRGEPRRAAPRKITLHAIELLSFSPDRFRVRITCSRGTYARVLADEIAIAMDSAGHLEALSRDRSGPFWIEDAIHVEELAAIVTAEEGRPWREALMPRRGDDRVPWRPRDEVLARLAPYVKGELDALGHLPLCDVGTVDAKRVRTGGGPPPPPRGVPIGGRYLVVHGADLVAVAESHSRGPKVLRVT